MRCFSLAQAAMERGIEVHFITYCESAPLLERLLKAGFITYQLDHSFFNKSDWEYTERILKSHPFSWIVLDGIHYRPEYHTLIKETGHKLLIIDDMAHLESYNGDIIINQNLHAHDLIYNRKNNAKLLMGTEYVILRQEFSQWRGKRKKITPHAGKILVTLGGMDPDNCTEKVLKALRGLSDINIIVLVGAANKNIDKIKAIVENMEINAKILQNSNEMSQLMEWADLTVSSGGTTVWELAFMGVPALVGRIAPIEEFLVAGLKQHGLSYDMGWFDKVSEEYISESVYSLIKNREKREELSILGQKMVDGLGCERVFKSMETVQ